MKKKIQKRQLGLNRIFRLKFFLPVIHSVYLMLILCISDKIFILLNLSGIKSPFLTLPMQIPYQNVLGGTVFRCHPIFKVFTAHATTNSVLPFVEKVFPLSLH